MGLVNPISDSNDDDIADGALVDEVELEVESAAIDGVLRRRVPMALSQLVLAPIYFYESGST